MQSLKRFFLPLLPLVLLALLPPRRWLPVPMNVPVVVVALMVAANAASLAAIVRAFYGL